MLESLDPEFGLDFSLCLSLLLPLFHLNVSEEVTAICVRYLRYSLVCLFFFFGTVEENTNLFFEENLLKSYPAPFSLWVMGLVSGEDNILKSSKTALLFLHHLQCSVLESDLCYLFCSQGLFL